MTGETVVAKEQIDVRSPEHEALLRNLQANILKPHGREFARHIFLGFSGKPDQVRAWIRESVAPLVTSALEQFQAAARRQEQADADGGTSCGFFLSAQGYFYVGLDPARFASDVFRRGIKDRRERRGLRSEAPPSAEWEVGFQGTIHALITLADDEPSRLEALVSKLSKGLVGAARVVGIESGNVLRRNEETVEHFGYLDGISQPLFTRQDIEADRQRNPELAQWRPSAPLGLVLTEDPFANATDSFGSYLVYLKLRQRVSLFRALVSRLASSLDISEDLAGALIVGRFKNGTPVVLSDHPDAALAKRNDFNFDEDPRGDRCPFHAHIRKANPRGTAPGTSLPEERAHRIVRRGIPYGPPIDADVAENVAADGGEVPRGLLFMCFQANIDEQFDFIQRNWVDNNQFPTALGNSQRERMNVGVDPLIGQDNQRRASHRFSDKPQRWPTQWGRDGFRPIQVTPAVELQGGEYFFAPSLMFLESI